MHRPPGTQGYEQEAPELLRRYEDLTFAEAHGPLAALVPSAPSLILDIGAGTGRDAAHFAALGHSVFAVEPTAAMREGAMRIHPDPRIVWLDDSLPRLDRVVALGQSYTLIWLSAVWMHLDPKERANAMPVLVQLLCPGGRMMMSLRHGPVPPGRRMFAVSLEETLDLAIACDLHAVPAYIETRLPSRQNQPGVSWTRLVLERPN